MVGFDWFQLGHCIATLSKQEQALQYSFLRNPATGARGGGHPQRDLLVLCMTAWLVRYTGQAETAGPGQSLTGTPLKETCFWISHYIAV